MSKLVDSSDRGPVDYFHFAAVFFGTLITAAGVIGTSPALTLFGVLILGFGVVFFLIDGADYGG